MHRDALISHLDTYLEAHRGGDYGPNGLQVEGRQEVHRLVTAVSACEELFIKARELDADAVLVHHGIFWDGMPSVLTGIQYRRVRQLIEGGLNLIAYHLPLDRHGELGNNALAARAFGLQELGTFAEAKGAEIGIYGRFPEPLGPSALAQLSESIFGQAPLHFAFGPDPVTSIGIISGGAQRELYGAIDLGLDAYLTGEVSEWVMNVAKEAGIHYLAAGHYATERLGVRALGEDLAQRFGLDVTFIDLPNPV
ncbi:MAG: Nif3-like dinuclear metal center hexameric protein [Acidobacteriota bacterium]